LKSFHKTYIADRINVQVSRTAERTDKKQIFETKRFEPGLISISKKTANIPPLSIEKVEPQ
jgi:hypothetical protein